MSYSFLALSKVLTNFFLCVCLLRFFFFPAFRVLKMASALCSSVTDFPSKLNFNCQFLSCSQIRVIDSYYCLTRGRCFLKYWGRFRETGVIFMTSLIIIIDVIHRKNFIDFDSYYTTINL